MRGIRLARDLLTGGGLPRIGFMTGADERFHHSQLPEAFRRAADPDSLKVIINWD
jgi:hypothetical protein